MGTVTPVGLDVPSTWDSLTKGRGGIGRITRFDPSPYETQIAGEVKGFDPLQFVDKKDVKKMDVFIQYAIAAAQFAMASGPTPRTFGAIGLPPASV